MEQRKNIVHLKSAIGLKDVFKWLNIVIESNGSYRCPIHGEDKIASAVYYEDSDTAYCFGCGKSYDILELVKDYFNISFFESIKKIESYFGIDYSEKLEKKAKILDDTKIKMQFKWEYDNKMSKYICTNKEKKLDFIKEIWDEKNLIDINLEVMPLEELKDAYRNWYEKYRGWGHEKTVDITGDSGNFVLDI